jgi:hypothetical protein
MAVKDELLRAKIDILAKTAATFARQAGETDPITPEFLQTNLSELLAAVRAIQEHIPVVNTCYGDK